MGPPMHVWIDRKPEREDGMGRCRMHAVLALAFLCQLQGVKATDMNNVQEEMNDMHTSRVDGLFKCHWSKNIHSGS